ncbi:MAG: PASTA domain-containing protein [Bacteroidia bacterium]|nr:PASTA domain-containing protein [Bacteroidia bacterium]NNF29852.1 PASTA domain-containing protein [Flavobacteriaceae bacterium]MBT8275759.1 PASTA domain-containing protein [Bacteroidia bacterium]NNJ81485.1 PASTA domain-containing protein [Flavobacteriaceae bacterium]NNK54191.1 PASTA domain-containing protein [Flavobacteriaceae bacterium]
MTFLKFLTTKTFLKQLLFALLAVIILTFLILWWLRSTTNHGQKIEVPNLAKLQLDAVEDKLDEMDLTYEILDSANYNPEYPRFSVIEQIPKAGNFVKEDRKIYLYLNPSGYRKIKIPPVVGKTLRQAEPTLEAMGFEIGKKSYRPYIAKDEVLELRHKGTKVEPGDELSKTAVIDLILGDGSGSLNRNAEAESDGDSEGTTDETNGGGDN